MEGLLGKEVTLSKDSCQYRFRHCATCDYLDYDIEEHNYSDDWDMRDYYEFYNRETQRWERVPTEPYYVYTPNYDLVLGSGDGLGNGSMCFRYKSCTNRARQWNCPRLFDEPEPHTFKLHNECEKWGVYYGEERTHYFSVIFTNEYYSSLSEIGAFDEIVEWLSNSNSRVYCHAGWCSRCSSIQNSSAVNPVIYEWHENNGMCRRTVVCEHKSVWDMTLRDYISLDPCNTVLYEETKPHNMVGNTCADCGYSDGDCTDPDCTDPNCPEHGNNNDDKCFFCGGTDKCDKCGNCSVCYTCRHCTDCNKRVWHDFEQYDSGLGYHWTIVPELIGDGLWEDIIEWLSDSQNRIKCYGEKCGACSNYQGTIITPIIKNWHERIYSNGFTACYRAITCSDCGDDVFYEVKVHNFVGDSCEDCGALKDGTNGNGGADIIITPSFTDNVFLGEVRRITGKPTGDIWLSDVENIKVFISNVSGIRDFAGIEHFTSLEELRHNARDRMVDSIDITQNLNLIRLNMSRQNLTSVNISKNTKLQHLDIDDNPIRELDISSNNEITHLYCARAQLEALDLSNLTKLEVLMVNSNSITSIVIPNSEKLHTVHVAFNNLQSIDLSQVPSLYYLFISGNRLSTIDLSQNQNLEILYINNNGMTTLDFTSNHKLRILNPSGNPIGTLDLSQNAVLEDLTINGNNISEIDLSNNPKLKYLRYSNATITNLDLTIHNELEYLNVLNVENITLDLHNKPNLEHLSIVNTTLNSLDLSNNMKLEYLWLTGNNISVLDLSQHSQLKEVAIQVNLITELDLSASGMLHRLFISNNKVPNRDAVKLADGVEWGGNIVFWG